MAATNQHTQASIDIEYVHASKYGNGASVAEESRRQMPSQEELAQWQRVRPIMNDLLQRAGLVKVAEDKVHVTGLKGPLEQGWQQKVAAFAARISPEVQGTDNGPEPVRAVPPAERRTDA